MYDRNLPSYFFWLDPLRAVAILLVLLHHSPTIPGLDTLQENGRRGVSLFFVISGFLITTLFLREEDRTGTISLKFFYLRRAARIFPLYFLVLAFEFFLVFVAGVYSDENRSIFQDKQFSYLFFFSNWRTDAGQGPFFIAWSLAVEEQFYLFFSLAYGVLRRTAVLLVLGLLLLKALIFALFGPELFQFWTWRVLFSYSEPILLGVLLSFALHFGWISGWILTQLARPCFFFFFALAALGLLFTVSFEHGSEWKTQILYLLLVVLVLTALLHSPRHDVASRSLSALGKMSYGIYLLHMFVLSGLKRMDLPAPIIFASTAALSFVIALLSYRFFEHPIIQWAKSRQQKEPLRPSAAIKLSNGGEGVTM